MKLKGLSLFLLLCGIVLLAPACNPRLTSTPEETSVPIVIPAAPTNTPAPTRQEAAPTQPPGETPDLFIKPQMTVLGTLESGIPFGITENGHSFKGDPDAPVMIIEFSEYQ